MGYTVYFTHNRPFTTQEWGDILASCIPMFHRLKQIKGGDGTGRRHHLVPRAGCAQ